MTETVLELTIGNIFSISTNKLAIFLSDVGITCVTNAFFKKQVGGGEPRKRWPLRMKIIKLYLMLFV